MRIPYFLIKITAISLICAASTFYTAFLISTTLPNKFYVGHKNDGAPQVCNKNPVFKIGYTKEKNGIISKNQGFTFSGNGWIYMYPCKSGKLTITASGESALKQPPILSISLNSENLLSEEFSNKKTLTINIPSGGNLRLGYFNDYYEADVRVAFLRSISLLNSKCGGRYNVSVPEGNGGDWKPDVQTITIVKSSSIFLTPCGKGDLFFETEGIKGKKEFAIIEIRQSSSLLKQIKLSSSLKSFFLKISDKPIEITLTNPYGKTLADRNLFLDSVVFASSP